MSNLETQTVWSRGKKTKSPLLPSICPYPSWNMPTGIMFWWVNFDQDSGGELYVQIIMCMYLCPHKCAGTCNLSAVQYLQTQNVQITINQTAAPLMDCFMESLQWNYLLRKHVSGGGVLQAGGNDSEEKIILPDAMSMAPSMPSPLTWLRPETSSL